MRRRGRRRSRPGRSGRHRGEVGGEWPDGEADVGRDGDQGHRLAAAARRSHVDGDRQRGDDEGRLAAADQQADERDAAQGRAQGERQVAEHHDQRADDDHLAPATPVGDPAGGRAQEEGADAPRADGDPDPDVAGRELVASVEGQREQERAERRERAQVRDPDPQHRPGE